jgi:hypothetical protein
MVLRDDTRGADRFILDGLSTTIASLPALRIGRSPGQLRMLLTSNRNRRIYKATISGQINDDLLFEATLAGRILTPAVYQRIRGGSPDSGHDLHRANRPTTASTVGRGRQSNVVIGAMTETDNGGFTAGLLVDDSHPAMFDHAVDHLPGSLVLEGIRQTLLKAALQRFAMSPSRGIPTRWSAAFTNFGELNQATDIQISLSPPTDSRPGPVEITGTARVAQGARPLAEASMSVAYLGAGSA